MNSVGLMSKSFMYSLGVHLSIVVVVFALIYDSQEHSCACGSMMQKTKVSLSSITREEIVEKTDRLAQVEKKITEVVKKVQQRPKKITQETPSVKKVELTNIEKKKLLTRNEQRTVKTQTPEKKVDKVNQVKKVQETMISQNQAKQAATKVQSEQDLKIACEKRYIQDNISLISSLIKQNLYYPRVAKKRGMQGKAMVSFVLNTHGEITQVKALGDIASILSRAAIKTVEKAASSFPHPKMSLSLQIPIVYKLAQR